MAQQILSRDWSVTPLGPFEAWPQSLRTVVSLCLASNFPINVIWGPEHIQIYNDGYSPICGAKNALGENYMVSWASAWSILNDAFERARAGETSFLENTRMFLDRNGYLEETFFTFSLSPIRDETGGIGGLFHPVTETTANMLNERRMRALRDLAAHAAEAKTVESACRLSIETLGQYPLDLPFLLLYLGDLQGNEFHLSAQAHMQPGTPASPLVLDHATREAGIWPLEEMIAGGTVRVSDIPARFGPLDCGPYPESPHSAFMLPISLPGRERIAGILIAGVSPRLPVDEGYRSFCDLVAAGVAVAIANARAYEEERERAEALAELDRAKTTFFSNVSHEFRTPLTLILGPVEDIIARLDGSVTVSVEEITLIYRNTLRLLKLVNALLDFSRIEAGRVQAHYLPVDLASLTRDLASVFRSTVEREGIQLAIDCPPLPEPVYVDRDMWEKIVLNLLSNAFKFTFTGEIRVTLTPREGAIELAVRDTGTGIPANELPRIFDRFRRVEGSRGRTHEGTGIGLAMVQELAQIHGGYVRAISAENEGSTFTVSIPLGFNHLPAELVAHESAVPAAGVRSREFVEEASRWISSQPGPSDSDFVLESPKPTNRGDAPARVLLADDNPDMREYVSRLLGGKFEVESVANGEDALKAALRRPPDLVLSDVMMPVLDGFGLLRALRSNSATAGVPVILLSARAGEEARVDGLGAGADDYLTKPFSARELVARVEINIELSRMRRAIAHQEELRDSQERLRAIVEQAGAGLAEMDIEHRFVLLNDQYCSIVGRSREDLLGERMEDITYSEDVARNLPLLRAAAEQGIPFTIEKRHLRPDGKLIWVNNHVTPIRGLDGNIRGLMTVSIDVTQRREIDEELRRSHAELEEFAFAASHDLQEPLRMVGLYTQKLMRGHVDPTNEEAKACADYVQDGVLRMHSLIRGLISYSQVIHEETPSGIETDLTVPCSQAVFNLNSQIEETGATIACGTLPIVPGDQNQFVHVFQNLISNALKFRTAEAPAIQITARREDREWVISLRDNGIGFDPRFAVRIFGLFKRLHRDEYPGTGIGLSISKHIVERNSGRIWADSTLGGGSTFCFTVPAGGPA
jgi:PAS domain S-box-containing protein